MCSFLIAQSETTPSKQQNTVDINVAKFLCRQTCKLKRLHRVSKEKKPIIKELTLRINVKTNANTTNWIKNLLKNLLIII